MMERIKKQIPPSVSLTRRKVCESPEWKYLVLKSFTKINASQTFTQRQLVTDVPEVWNYINRDIVFVVTIVVCVVSAEETTFTLKKPSDKAVLFQVRRKEASVKTTHSTGIPMQHIWPFTHKNDRCLNENKQLGRLSSPIHNNAQCKCNHIKSSNLLLYCYR